MFLHYISCSKPDPCGWRGGTARAVVGLVEAGVLLAALLAGKVSCVCVCKEVRAVHNYVEECAHKNAGHNVKHGVLF